MITIFVTTEFEALHHWQSAPPEVIYLSYPHRHLFKVMLEVYVSNVDREIEFLKLKYDLTNFCKGTWNININFPNGNSCEAMCLAIKDWAEKNNLKVYSVTVSEDGENGATYRPSIIEQTTLGERIFGIVRPLPSIEIPFGVASVDIVPSNIKHPYSPVVESDIIPKPPQGGSGVPKK